MHVQRDDRIAKFWLDPVAVASNNGFAKRELTRLLWLVSTNRRALLEAWYARFPF